MPDPTLKEINNAVDEIRNIVNEKGLSVEDKGKLNALDLDKVDKINTFLDEQETKNQANQVALKTAETAAEETKERMDVLEAELARKIAQPGEGKNYKESEEYKALQGFIIVGPGDISREEKALMRTDSDNAGGYLVTGETDNMITKAITEISNIRSIARVRTITKKSLEMPIRKTVLDANYEGEAETGGEDASTYGAETLTAFRLTVTVPITMDQLMNSSFDMESEIMSDAAEGFAQKEGNRFVLGTGVKQPEGFTTNAEILANVRTSSTSATIDAEDVILLTGDLKVGYDPTYVMNRTTLANLRTKKSTGGDFLWQPGMNGPVANTINGFPYILAQDMPDIAANSLSIAFGDFRRGYTIVDRTGVSVIRDDVTSKKAAVVEFTIHRWNYGQVTLPEAIKLLKTAA